jgi:hypothetical protein
MGGRAVKWRDARKALARHVVTVQRTRCDHDERVIDVRPWGKCIHFTTENGRVYTVGMDYPFYVGKGER